MPWKLFSPLFGFNLFATLPPLLNTAPTSLFRIFDFLLIFGEFVFEFEFDSLLLPAGGDLFCILPNFKLGAINSWMLFNGRAGLAKHSSILVFLPDLQVPQGICKSHFLFNLLQGPQACDFLPPGFDDGGPAPAVAAAVADITRWCCRYAQ